MINLRIFSVSEYVGYLNEALAERDAVVEGEVSEYRVNQGKWVFFKIKDENAVLDCFGVVFKLKFPLEDGMRVRLYGRPGIYAKSGKFSITVEWVEPVGAGALKRAFELLKAELEKEGLFARERKRAIPRFPKRIGLITSREAAAYKDFIKVLQHRFGGIEIYFYHVQVQGAEAAADIARAFEYFNAHQPEFQLDAVVLIRGGGSMEDLAAFNSRETAYAVFGSLAPVVVGVGHEQDVTIADFVADVRASTPSNAAELVAPQRESVAREVAEMTGALERGAETIRENYLRRVDLAVTALDRYTLGRIHGLEGVFKKLALHLNFFGERITMQKSKIDNFARLIKSFSPQAVLERGYALVRKEGKVISSVNDLKTRDVIGLRLKDGEIGAEVL